MIVVADTSVLLNLCCVGHEQLLQNLFQQVFVPPEVKMEFERLASVSVRFKGLKFPTWVQQKSASGVPSLVRSAVGLDRGESAALSLAVEIRADAILVDERRGHEIALQLGLKTVGILGILVQAKAQDLLENVKPVIDRLESDASFWIAPGLRSRVLDIVGE